MDYEFYNKYFLKTREDGAIIDAWSDGPLRDKPTDGAILLTDRGGYQFRLYPGGEENPPLWTEDGLPLYKWDGEAVQRRTEAEIEADRKAIPPPPPSRYEVLRADTDFLLTIGGYM